MAAGAFEFYNSAKLDTLDGTRDYDTDSFLVALCISGSNASALDLSSLGSVTSQLASGNGYSSSGMTLSSVSLATGASASEIRWDASDWIQTASGGAWSSVQFAVVHVGGVLVGKIKLSTSGFDVTDSNTLTIQWSANGIAELN